MGGRGVSSAVSGASRASSKSDYSRGDIIASLTEVDPKTAAEMYDAVNHWAAGSTGIKNAQRGGRHTEQDAKDAQILDEFISKMPSYQGELVRAIGVPAGTTFRKNGKIYSDGSITSWTVPSNLENAKTFVRESDQLVVLHVSATKGADTRRVSQIAHLDGEIIQSRGYDSSLTIEKVVTKNEYRPGSYTKEKVKHVYLRE